MKTFNDLVKKKEFQKQIFKVIIIVVVTVLIIFLASLIIDHLNHVHNIVCITIYHILINSSVTGWISGIGSLSAAVVALFLGLHKGKPHIIKLKYSNPHDHTVIIQFVNRSSTPDFIRLSYIYEYTTKPYDNSVKDIPLSLKFAPMIVFNRIDDEHDFQFVLSDKKYPLLKKFEKQKRYNALEFKFYDFDKQKFYSIIIKLNKDLAPMS